MDSGSPATPTVSRMAAAPGGPASTSVMRSAPPAALRGPGVQRLATERSSLPLARSAPGSSTTPAPGPQLRHQSIVAAPADATVQRSAGSPGSGGAAAAGGGNGAIPPLSVTPVVQRVEGSAPAAPQGRDSVGNSSERELDELAGALFGRIRTRLRSELIHDREARGLTFDRM
jgi:hypothetical protein